MQPEPEGVPRGSVYDQSRKGKAASGVWGDGAWKRHDLSSGWLSLYISPDAAVVGNCRSGVGTSCPPQRITSELLGKDMVHPTVIQPP